MASQWVPLICIRENVFIINLKVVLNTLKSRLMETGGFEENKMGLNLSTKCLLGG